MGSVPKDLFNHIGRFCKFFSKSPSNPRIRYLFSSKSEQSESLNPKIFSIVIANLITEYESQSWQETRTWIGRSGQVVSLTKPLHGSQQLGDSGERDRKGKGRERERKKKNAIKIVLKVVMLWPLDCLIATCHSSNIKNADNWRLENGRGATPIEILCLEGRWCNVENCVILLLEN